MLGIQLGLGSGLGLGFGLASRLGSAVAEYSDEVLDEEHHDVCRIDQVTFISLENTLAQPKNSSCSDLHSEPHPKKLGLCYQYVSKE